MTTNSNLLDLAKLGDAKAIGALMNHQLQPKGINVKTTLTNGCLFVIAESDEAPEQTALVDLVRKGITNLKPKALKRVVIQGRSNKSVSPVWRDSFDLPEANPLTQELSVPDNKVNTHKAPVSSEGSSKLVDLLRVFTNFRELINTALLLGILLILTVNLVAVGKPKAVTWEYKIESIDDTTFDQTIQRLGSDGWEIASARRAVSGEGSNSHGIYEVIFKRPK